MKNIVHTFSRDVVHAFLKSRDGGSKNSRNFELIAALIMHRLYEQQWKQPTMIGFYLTAKYAKILSDAGEPSHDLLIEALNHGIDENHQIDFVISTYFEENGAHQEFQLKRFGMEGQIDDTDSLIAYLNGMSKKYVQTDAACLVALADIRSIDLPKINRDLNKESFPFAELLLAGIASDKFIVAALLPDGGASVYDLDSWDLVDILRRAD